MRRSLAVVCLIFVLHISGSAQETRTCSNWKEAMLNYDYKAAITMLDTQLDSLKGHLNTIQDSTTYMNGSQMLKEMLLQKASCQKNLYKFNDAITTLDEALQSWGEDAVIFANIAECHRLSGNDIAAFIFYDNAVRMAPDNLFLRIQKMMLEYKMEEYGRCLADGRHILKKDTIPTILITMGNCFNKINRSDSALAYYGKAYGMNPYDYRTLEKISNIYLGQDMYDTVLTMSTNYLERDSTNHVIAPIRGLAQYGLKDYKGSYETFKKSLEYGCDELSGYWYLGLSKYMDKEYRNAREWFKKALQLDSADANIPYYIGMTYAKESSHYHETAEKYLNMAESMLQPDSTMMYKISSSKGELYINSEQFDKAVRQLEAARKYGELQPSQLSALGYAYRRLKDYDNAMKCYNRYLEIGKRGTAMWKFVEAEIAFIKEEQFMSM